MNKNYALNEVCKIDTIKEMLNLAAQEVGNQTAFEYKSDTDKEKIIKKTYKEFKQQFIENLYHDSYKQEREKSLPLIHKYRDFNSCERIYKVMESLK